MVTSVSIKQGLSMLSLNFVFRLGIADRKWYSLGLNFQPVWLHASPLVAYLLPFPLLGVALPLCFCSSLILRQLEGHLLYEISPTHSFSSTTPRSLSPFDLLHAPWILASSCQEHFSVLACPPALGAQPDKSTEDVRFTLKLRSESVQLEELGMLFDLLNYLISLSYTDFKKKKESSSSCKK